MTCIVCLFILPVYSFLMECEDIFRGDLLVLSVMCSEKHCNAVNYCSVERYVLV